MSDLYHLLRQARVYDLAQPYFVGMPHYPTHPPFLFSLTKKHGDLLSDSGMSSAAEAITLGGHVGTHLDALCHFSYEGKMHGDIKAEPIQSYGEGIRELSVDTVAPIIRRGVLLDIAAHVGVDALPADFTITAGHLEECAGAQGVEVLLGDVVILRTGWARFWNDPARYITGGRGSQAAGPGPEIDGARWLSRRGVFATGSDTIAFEKIPPPTMAVHVHLLVESGIYIMEALNLEEISSERVYEFLFIAVPLKIRGGTGSPIRPLALVNPGA